MYIGAHMTAPLSTVPERTRLIGGNTFQIFSHSPRMWGVNIKNEDPERDTFLDGMKKFNIESDKVMIHASYLINLASSKDEVIEKSKKLLKNEIKIAELLKIKYVNFHPGSGLGDSEDVAIERISHSLAEIVEGISKDVTLLIEIVSPKGGNVGYNFHQLRKIAELSGYDAKFTYDTCHGFDAGYDITTPYGLSKLMDEIDDTVGRDNLVMCHLNDSMYPLGIHKDRHERIGKGYIGINGFKNFFSNEFFRSIPMILETPGNDEEHMEDIRIVKEIIKN
uniref:Probable endonuclease 4 n=1 Tax=Mesoaciditoga lauensis TaxID=1495039 RepID=A0A7V3RDU4_9BACT